MCYVKMVSKSSITVLFLLLIENIECSIELARGRQAESNGASPWYWYASNTVDGYTNTNLRCGSCLQTEQERPAYLKVDLGDQYTINRVIIYFAKSRPEYCQDESIDEGWKERFQKRNMRITVRVKNTNTINGTICHKDSTPVAEYKSFDLFQNISCRTTGRYVSIVQYYVSQEPHITNPILAVCEIKVYGCRVNFYGPNCGSRCSEHCEAGKCDPDFGCLECVGRRTNADCSECQDGTYGYNCNETCRACLNGDVCDKKNGSCPQKCDLGFRGKYCKRECDAGFYGHNCNETCGNCLRNGTCDSKSGHCSQCEDGYMYPLCKEQCPNGTYGYHCNDTCGYCSGGEHCHWKSGMCPNGCNLGYSGTTCKTECANGTYGFNCDDICGNCIGNETCHSQFGNCSVCKPGYKDSLCKQPCEAQFGQNCERNCGECRNGQPCHHITGVCEDGRCDRGYHGELCLEQCSPGFYGHNCVETCGKCSDNETCDSKFGICSACADEYIPPLCKQQTPRNAELQESNNIPIGAIVGGNVGAVIVILTIIILGVILLRRNQFKQRNDRSNTKIKLANETRQTEQFYETSQRTNDEHQYSKCGDTSSTFEQPELTIFDKETIENVYTNVNF